MVFKLKEGRRPKAAAPPLPSFPLDFLDIFDVSQFGRVLRPGLKFDFSLDFQGFLIKSV